MRISDWSSDVCSSDLAVERAGGGRIEGVDRQRRFARARDAGDAGEGAERELRIDIPEVVGARALDGEVLARALAAAGRERPLAAAGEIIGGDAFGVAENVVERAPGDDLAAVRARADRTSVGEGKRVVGRVSFGGRRINKKKTIQ